MNLTSLPLQNKAAHTRQLLQNAVREYGPLVYANSLGAEAMVLTDIICSDFATIDVVTIDTGRLHEETYDLLGRLQARYPNRIRVLYPEGEAVSKLVSAQGINGFFNGLDERKACCAVRKIVPFRKVVEGYNAWITGVRKDQSAARAEGKAVEWDASHNLYKVSPLLDWTEEDVWAYIKLRRLTYNTLHDKQYPSIGCAPCTRPVLPGEDQRAGRWWWEQPESRECGLHPATLGRAKAVQ